MAPQPLSRRVRLRELVRRHRAETVWIAVAIAAGIAIRAWLIVLPTGAFDSDEAVVGLIARHALHQREFHTFYWGQAYGGTLEPLLAVPMFAIAGARVGVLKALPLLLSAVTALLVWRVGRRT